MRLVSWGFIVIGIIFLGYYSIQYFQSTQSVSEYDAAETNTSNNHNEEETVSNNNNNEEDTDDKSEKTTEEKEKIMSEELDRHNVGDDVATLKIPKLDKQFTTYWGTDENTLKQGVGMYVSEWTVTPEEAGNVVLSGHRDTVFTGLDQLEDGDKLELEYRGETYEYSIRKTWITDPEDRSVIVDKDDSMLTLTTCYPFDFVGNAPERYIVEAVLEE
ncbi:MAG TPA: class D sortase [Virgibacillus sp.]|nr:class D sortase [Virgibacillus sp.]HLR69590.1 class D sortase [Virgibacillus sp.]